MVLPKSVSGPFQIAIYGPHGLGKPAEMAPLEIGASKPTIENGFRYSELQWEWKNPSFTAEKPENTYDAK